MPTRKVSVVMSSAALSSQGTIPTPEQVCAAAKAVGYALGDQDYALVGGAACVLLDSTRATEDVDIVVPKGNTRLPVFMPLKLIGYHLEPQMAKYKERVAAKSVYRGSFRRYHH